MSTVNIGNNNNSLQHSEPSVHPKRSESLSATFDRLSQRRQSSDAKPSFRHMNIPDELRPLTAATSRPAPPPQATLPSGASLRARAVAADRAALASQAADVRATYRPRPPSAPPARRATTPGGVRLAFADEEARLSAPPAPAPATAGLVAPAAAKAMREDVGPILEAAASARKQLRIEDFSCDWAPMVASGPAPPPLLRTVQGGLALYLVTDALPPPPSPVSAPFLALPPVGNFVWCSVRSLAPHTHGVLATYTDGRTAVLPRTAVAATDTEHRTPAPAVAAAQALGLRGLPCWAAGYGTADSTAEGEGEVVPPPCPPPHIALPPGFTWQRGWVVGLEPSRARVVGGAHGVSGHMLARHALLVDGEDPLRHAQITDAATALADATDAAARLRQLELQQFERERRGIDRVAALVERVRATNATAGADAVAALAATADDALLAATPIRLRTASELDRVLARVQLRGGLRERDAETVEALLHEVRIDHVLAVVSSAIAEARVRDASFSEMLQLLKLPPTTLPTTTRAVVPVLGGDACRASGAARRAACRAIGASAYQLTPRLYHIARVVRRTVSTALLANGGPRLLDMASLAPRTDTAGWAFVCANQSALRACIESANDVMTDIGVLAIRGGAGLDAPLKGTVTVPAVSEVLETHLRQGQRAVITLINKTSLSGLANTAHTLLFSTIPGIEDTLLPDTPATRALLRSLASAITNNLYYACCECCETSVAAYCRSIEQFAAVRRVFVPESEHFRGALALATDAAPDVPGPLLAFSVSWEATPATPDPALAAVVGALTAAAAAVGTTRSVEGPDGEPQQRVVSNIDQAAPEGEWGTSPLMCASAGTGAGTLDDPVVCAARAPAVPPTTRIVPSLPVPALTFTPPLSVLESILQLPIDLVAATPTAVPDAGAQLLAAVGVGAAEVAAGAGRGGEEARPVSAEYSMDDFDDSDADSMAQCYSSPDHSEAPLSDVSITKIEDDLDNSLVHGDDGTPHLPPVPPQLPWLLDARARTAALAARAVQLPATLAVLAGRHAWVLAATPEDVDAAYAADTFCGDALAELLFDTTTPRETLVARADALYATPTPAPRATTTTDAPPPPPASRADLEAELLLLRDAVLAPASALSTRHINTGLIDVDATAALAALVTAATALHTAVTEVAAKRAVTRYRVCGELWRRAVRVLTDHSTPEAFDAARTFLRRLPAVRTALEHLCADAEAYTALVERCGAPTTCFSEPANATGIAYATVGPRAATEAAEVFGAGIAAVEGRFLAELGERNKGLAAELKRVVAEVGSLSSLSSLTDTATNAARVRAVGENLARATATAANITAHETILNTRKTHFGELADVQAAYAPYADLWSVAEEMVRDAAVWLDGQFDELDPGVMERAIRDRTRRLTAVVKWLNPAVAPIVVDDEIPTAAFPATSSPLEAAQTLLRFLGAMARRLALIRALRHPGMRPRHWEQVSEVLGHPVTPASGATLSRFLQLGADAATSQITRVSTTAVQEQEIERSLDAMTVAWRETAFTTTVKELPEGPVTIVTQTDVIQQLLDDHIVTALALRSSPYVGPFEKRAVEWERLLQSMQSTLDLWLAVQRAWLHLAPILSSPDIRRQLPSEAADFTEIDSSWRVILAQTLRASQPVSRALTRDGLADQLSGLLTRLERVERGLEDYVESARLTFPRFHFLASEELVQLLAQARFPRAAEPHLRKCFEGLQHVTFTEGADGLSIVAMGDDSGESVELAPVSVLGPTPSWLLALENAMRVAVKAQVAAAGADLGSVQDEEDEEGANTDYSARMQWLQRWPAQVVLAVDAASWALEVADALASTGASALSDLVSVLDRRLHAVVALVRDTSLGPRLRTALGAFIVQAVHARDVTERLAAADATPTSFAWRSVLRYTAEDDNLVIRQCDAVINYGYEYLGVTGRLVITPLTDRCYLTLTGALHNLLGGAPEGPAGTGKTETVKDLGKVVATYTLTFNGQESLNAASMARFIRGLALAGAYSCWDEFNRIPLPVLSVIAEYIFAVQNGLRAAGSGQAGTAHIEGQAITVMPTFATFITMNPGYAGRTELPDNLKALFRPVAMVVPDYALIAEIVLFSDGFEHARDLARKMVATLRLSSEQLSSQPHYDFGMRAVKAILAAAGHLARTTLVAGPRIEHEQDLILRAIRDVSVPKFVANDVPLFTAIVHDLFPGRTLPVVAHELFAAALADVCTAQGLACTDVFAAKALQLYDSLAVRHGVMVVGDSLSGKSTVISVVAAACTLAAGRGAASCAPTRVVRINPKALTLAQLYGAFDDASGEWTDGVVPAAIKEAAELPGDQWVVFDGPVDALWIENMNTVLDDNKKLCMSSGEVIALTPEMRMVFEVADLAQASPATVSRCGMVYTEPAQLGHMPLVERLVRRHLPTTVTLTDAQATATATTTTYSDVERTAEAKPAATSDAVDAAAESASLMRRLLVSGAVLRVFGALCPALGALVETAPAAHTIAPAAAQHAAQTATQLCSAMFAHLHAAILHTPTASGDAEGEGEGTAGTAVAAKTRWSWTTVAPRTLQAVAENIALFSVVWAHCGMLNEAGRAAVAGVVSCIVRGGDAATAVTEWPESAIELIQLSTKAGQTALAPCPLLTALPASVLDAVPALWTPAWVPWAAAVEAATGGAGAVGAGFTPDTLLERLPPGGDPFGELVPTLPVTVARSLLHVLFTADTPVLLCGPAGCGKSSLARSYLLDGPGDVAVQGYINGRADVTTPWSDTVLPVTTALTAGTSAADIRTLVLDSVPRRRKRALGPPPGTRLSLFFDDLSLPAPVVGSQPPLELLRTLIDTCTENGHGLCAGAGTGTFVGVEDVTVVAAMRPPGGGAYPVSQRVVGRFALVGIPEPDDQSLLAMFATPLVAAFRLHHADVAADLAHKLALTAIDLHATVTRTVRAVPARAWYQLSLRDLGRLVRSVAAVAPEALRTRDSVVSAFVHEAERVYGDRLADAPAAAALASALASAVTSLGCSPAQHLTPAAQALLAAPSDTTVTAIPALSAQTFVQTPVSASYAPVTDVPALDAALDAALAAHNAANPTDAMHIVLFNENRATLLHLLRVLAQPAGSVLLVGTGGSGRRSLARLAAFMLDIEVSTISIGASYGISEWHDDLRLVVRRAGLDQVPCALMLSDTQLSPTLLRDVNALIAAGSVPRLFEAEDEQSVVDTLVRAGVSGTRAAVLSEFARRVRANLRLVLCYSPSGEGLRDMLQTCPSVAACAVPLYVSPWQLEAQVEVARSCITRELAACEFNDGPYAEAAAAAAADAPDPATGAALALGAGRIKTTGLAEVVARAVVACGIAAAEVGHAWAASAGTTYAATPQSIVLAARRSVQLLSEMHRSVSASHDRYSGGLTKIADATAQVSTLQAQLQELRPVLAASQTETEHLVQELHTKRAAAHAARTTAQSEESKAAVAADEARQIRTRCDSELSAAMPALEAAEEALRALKRQDVIEMKSMKSPPQGVRQVMEAVCVMLGERPVMVPDPNAAGRRIADYWATSQRILGDNKFLTRLFDFDRDNISESVISSITPFLSDPSFVPSEVARASQAAAGLCAWVRALASYHNVSRVVRPLRESLAEATGRLEAAEGVVAAAQAELATITAEMTELEVSFKNAQATRQRLQGEHEQCVGRLGRARQLLEGLATNSTIWAEKVVKLRLAVACTAGDAIFASITECYTASLDISARATAAQAVCAVLREHGLPVAAPSYASLRASDLEISDWAVQGLPASPFSVDSGALILHSAPWPLVVDPEGQAAAWVQSHYRSQGTDIYVTRPDDGDVVRTLETGARLGRPVLMLGCSAALPPSIMPLICQQTFDRSGARCVKIGDTITELREGFRVILCAPSANVELPAELFTSVCVTNFAVTSDGLAEQLLAIAVSAEMPELGKARISLLQQMSDDQRALAAADERILTIISNSQNLLDDEQLISVLGDAATLAADTTRRAHAASATEKQIAAAHGQFNKLACTGVGLFFALQAMTLVNSVYATALSTFTDLFAQTVATCTDSTDSSTHVDTLCQSLITHTLAQTGRGVFGADHPTLYLTAALWTLQAQGRLAPQALQALAQGEWDTEEKYLAQNPALSPVFAQRQPGIPVSGFVGVAVLAGKLPAHAAAQLPARAPLPEFIPIFDSLCTNPAWSSWQPPAPAPAPTTPTTTLILTRLLHPEVFEEAALAFSSSILGPEATRCPPLSVPDLLARSSAARPVLFILAPGSDPTAQLLACAEDNGAASRLQIISLGDGQGPRATAAVTTAAERGSWVVLQNLHVAGGWADKLWQLVESLRSSPSLHRGFRLWITTQASPDLPPQLVRECVKCVSEDARGVRAAVTQAYTASSAACPHCPGIWRRIQWSLHMLHAALIERRRYGPIGWTRPYEFGDADLALTTAQTIAALQDVRVPADVPWEALCTLAGDVNYGGRVTDDVDRRALSVLTAQYLSPHILEPSAVLLGGSQAPSLAVLSDEGARAQAIAALPDVSPQMAGLAPAAAILNGISATARLSLRLGRAAPVLPPPPKIAGSGASENTATSETTKSTLSSGDSVVSRLLRALPAAPAADKLFRQFPPKREASLNVVIVQEAVKFAKLVGIVRSDLVTLQSIFRGEDVLTPERAVMLDELSRNVLPEAWKAVSYASQATAAGWVDDLASRVEFIMSWSQVPSISLPSFWLPGFYFPHGFFTAVLQDAARRFQLPIDELGFACRVLTAAPARAPRTGTVVHGLSLEGGAWSHEEGIVELPPGTIVAQMPPVQLLVVRERAGHAPEMIDAEELESVSPAARFEVTQVPLYRTALRFGVRSTTGHSTNFVRFFGLPSALSPEHWALRGTALLCSTERAAE